jgi:hypothetical protein
MPRAISFATESGEFRKNDLDFLSWAFLSLLSGMLDVKRVSSGPPVPEAALSAEGMADQTVGLFLKGVL